MTNITQPIIILVRPQLGANIGMCARVLKNFSFTQLRIVAPRDGWPNHDAALASAGADTILENCKIFDTVASACHDVQYLYATTARKRNMTLDFITPDECAQHTISHIKQHHQTAIMFGAERSGLSNEEIALCDKAITFDVNPNFPSLNIAQSVGLMIYEISKKINDISLVDNHHIDNDCTKSLASVKMTDHFCHYLCDELYHSNFYKSPEKQKITEINIMRIIKKMQPTQDDIQMFYGIVKALQGKFKP